MRVKIGKYISFWGVTRILTVLKVPENIVDWIYYNTPIDEIFKKIYEWRTRNGNRDVKIKIDKWDLYMADKTLAYIIIPVLIKFRDTTMSYPHDDLIKNFEDWTSVLNKMIWSFEKIINYDWRDDCDTQEKINEQFKKIQEGLDLFGKYFQDLWS